jgi:hypothetical protein
VQVGGRQNVGPTFQVLLFCNIEDMFGFLATLCIFFMICFEGEGIRGGGGRMGKCLEQWRLAPVPGRWLSVGWGNRVGEVPGCWGYRWGLVEGWAYELRV